MYVIGTEGRERHAMVGPRRLEVNLNLGTIGGMTYLLVGIGGALGAMARHAVNHVVHQHLLAARFPWGIFAINIVGSFAIGLLGGLLVSERLVWGYPMRTFVIVGVLGGFTTFSSFSFDTLALSREGLPGQALLNVVGQVGCSLVAVWVGYGLSFTKN